MEISLHSRIWCHTLLWSNIRSSVCFLVKLNACVIISSHIVPKINLYVPVYHIYCDNCTERLLSMHIYSNWKVWLDAHLALQWGLPLSKLLSSAYNKVSQTGQWQGLEKIQKVLTIVSNLPLSKLLLVIWLKWEMHTKKVVSYSCNCQTKCYWYIFLVLPTIETHLVTPCFRPFSG